MNIDAAQRIQHGSVRVLMSLKGTEVRGLRQDFDGGYYTRRSDAVMACKSMCYSDLECQYWLYSTSDGCFVEDPPMHSVAYPLTQHDINKNSEFAKSVIDGEYILHRCPENDGSFTSKDEHAKFTLLPWEWNWFAFHWPWDEGGWPWWGWLLFIILSCCCCGCILLCCGVFGLCNILKNRVKGKKGSTAPAEESASESSDSETERKHSSPKSQKQGLLQSQHMNSLAQGHGHQATQALHSSGGSLHGNRPGFGKVAMHG